MKKITFLIIIITLFFIGYNNTLAYTLEQNPVSNVWIFRKGGGKPAFSSQFKEYFIDGHVVYCIEPGEHITTTSYKLYNDPYYIHRTVRLLGIYGYGYKNHTTLKHKLATQALMWEIIGGQIVEYWTEPSGAGKEIIVNAEKQEIMNEVNRHRYGLVFDTYEQTANLGDELIFNGNFIIENEFDIIDYNDATINGNKLIVKATNIGEHTITLKRRIDSNNNNLFIYEGEDNVSQKMAYFEGFEEYVKVKIKVNGGNVLLEKVNNNDEYISGVSFNLYKDNKLIKEFTTSSDKYIIKNLEYGSYCLREINAPDEYELLSNDYCFQLNEEEKIIKLVNDYKIIEPIDEDVLSEYIEVPKTLSNKNYIDILFIIMGLLIISYEKKKIYN